MADAPRELRSRLWDCAEILRGSAVDRTDWKAYILPRLFFKRICPHRQRADLEGVVVAGGEFADEFGCELWWSPGRVLSEPHREMRHLVPPAPAAFSPHVVAGAVIRPVRAWSYAR
jgi:hypothetical protein